MTENLKLLRKLCRKFANDVFREVCAVGYNPDSNTQTVKLAREAMELAAKASIVKEPKRKKSK